MCVYDPIQVDLEAFLYKNVQTQSNIFNFNLNILNNIHPSLSATCSVS